MSDSDSDQSTTSASSRLSDLDVSLDTTPRTIHKVKVGNIQVSLVTGNISEQKCEVIVTSIIRKLDFQAGPLSKDLAEKAGPALQAECTTKYPQGIQFGEVAVLGPGNLPACKHVFCGALPRHDNGGDESQTPTEFLNKLVTACLQEACKLNADSICFPALGAGYLKFPPKVVAKTLLKAIDAFSSTNRNCCLRRLCVVLLNDANSLKRYLPTFEQEFKTFSPRPIPESRRLPRVIYDLPRGNSPAFSTLGATSMPSGTAGAVSTPARNTPEFCLFAYQRDIYPPCNWTNFTNNITIKQWIVQQKGKPDYKLVDVNQSTFKSIENLVHGTWNKAHLGHGRDAKNLADLNYSKLKVLKIQRLENLSLFEGYAQKQQKLLHKAGDGPMFTTLDQINGIKYGASKTNILLDDALKWDSFPEVNEGYFFHGTKKDRVDALCKNGMDPRLAQSGAVFGQAVYMAESSTKADQYTDDRDDRRKTDLLMMLLRTTLGKICPMNEAKKLRRPPCVSDCSTDECDHERYDSVVQEDVYIFREFIVYEPNLVYPEYLITYNRE